MLLIYRILINFTLLISPIIVILRIIKNKEHPRRFLEKYSIPSKKRRSGKLVWFHGSSVGETLSVIPLVEKLEKDKNIHQILITSNTLSSSKIFENLKFRKTVHQFFPIDSNIIIKKFLNYWKPSLVLFIESEIWPNMMIDIKKKNINLILLNARITKKTFSKWRSFKNISYLLFNKFNVCLAQNSETVNYLKKLGVKKVRKIGNLKFSEPNINKINYINRDKINFLSSKKILFGAISTHFNEEVLCSKIHLKLKKKFRNGITIIIPRHADRCIEIKNELEQKGLIVYLHSSSSKINKNTDIYLVDTYGETQSFMRVCNIVFLGGSLIKHGGQNPLEAARLGCKVIHGPYVNNFTEVYNLLEKINISSKIKNINQAEKEIFKSLISKKSINKNLKKLNNLGKKILVENTEEIKKYL